MGETTRLARSWHLGPRNERPSRRGSNKVTVNIWSWRAGCVSHGSRPGRSPPSQELKCLDRPGRRELEEGNSHSSHKLDRSHLCESIFHPKNALPSVFLPCSLACVESRRCVGTGRHNPFNHLGRTSTRPRPAQSRTAARKQDRLAACKEPSCLGKFPICGDDDEVSKRPGSGLIWNGCRLTRGGPGEKSRPRGVIGPCPPSKVKQRTPTLPLPPRVFSHRTSK